MQKAIIPAQLLGKPFGNGIRLRADAAAHAALRGHDRNIHRRGNGNRLRRQRNGSPARNRHDMRILQEKANLPRRRARHFFHHARINVRIAANDADPFHIQPLRQRQLDAGKRPSAAADRARRFN